jgi:hypothetical protein
MRALIAALFLAPLACATQAPRPAPLAAVPPPAPPIATTTVTAALAALESCPAPVATSTQAALVEAELDDDAVEAPNGVSEEVEVLAPNSDPDRLRYTTELDDEALAKVWKERPEDLGSISAGFAHEGRLINGVKMPPCEDGSWMVVIPSWGTAETIEAIKVAAREVKRLHPNAFPLRVNQISAIEGGYVRPHRSHQNGRDVDLGFYYPTESPSRIREREKVIDVPQNWSLLKALITLTDVQVVLLDKRVQAVLYAHALSIGEDQRWLDSIFKAGPASLVQHARRHRDHFHVRFYNAKAQELGHRVAPLLAMRPEHNIMHVRIKNGDTLGHLAMRYNSTIAMIQKQNRMRGTFLRIGQVVQVPLRGPCNRCPIPPAIEVPARKLPPPSLAPALLTTTATTATGTISASFSSLRE